MERKKFILPTALILSLLVVNDVGVANAAYIFDNNAAVTEIAGGGLWSNISNATE